MNAAHTVMSLHISVLVLCCGRAVFDLAVCVFAREDGVMTATS
jgi:hypothetical protein